MSEILEPEPEASETSPSSLPPLLSDFDRGRLQGLEEAASIVAAAAGKASEVRIVSPSRQEQRAKGFNTGLLLKVATLIRKYGADVVKGQSRGG